MRVGHSPPTPSCPGPRGRSSPGTGAGEPGAAASPGGAGRTVRFFALPGVLSPTPRLAGRRAGTGADKLGGPGRHCRTFRHCHHSSISSPSSSLDNSLHVWNCSEVKGCLRASVGRTGPAAAPVSPGIWCLDWDQPSSTVSGSHVSCSACCRCPHAFPSAPAPGAWSALPFRRPCSRTR